MYIYICMYIYTVQRVGCPLRPSPDQGAPTGVPSAPSAQDGPHCQVGGAAAETLVYETWGDIEPHEDYIGRGPHFLGIYGPHEDYTGILGCGPQVLGSLGDLASRASNGP